MDNVIVEKIRREIENLDLSQDVETVGRVTRVGDGIVEIEGLDSAVMSEMILFAENENASLKDAIEESDVVYGLILNLEEESTKAVVLGDTSRVYEGMTVKSLGKVLSIPVGDSFIGRVVNPLGEPLDEKGPISSSEEFPIERQAYGVIERGPVDTPLHTGIKAIDAMTPIGRGQRELIIGDRFTGKTTIAVDTILNQLNEPEAERPICIYVSIGQKESKTAQIVARLQEAGSMQYTIVVDAGAAAPAAFQFLAPFAGVTLGEYFMQKGKDVLVVYDDLSKHAVAYRQMSLLLRRPPGREAYPGDIFYLHSRLLERAAKLSDKLGGGSITALPVIETQEGDVSAYISTNVISITDGQVFLDTNMFNKGLLPPVDVGISVSRVGGAAQTKAMKSVAGKIKLELAQFRELEAFMQFSQDLDAETKKRIESGQRMTQLLTQGKHAPIAFERQVAVIFAGVRGLLDDAPVEKIDEIEERMLAYFDREGADVLKAIREDKKLGDELEEKLTRTITAFKEANPELFDKTEE